MTWFIQYSNSVCRVNSNDLFYLLQHAWSITTRESSKWSSTKGQHFTYFCVASDAYSVKRPNSRPCDSKDLGSEAQFSIGNITEGRLIPDVQLIYNKKSRICIWKELVDWLMKWTPYDYRVWEHYRILKVPLITHRNGKCAWMFQHWVYILVSQSNHDYLSKYLSIP